MKEPTTQYQLAMAERPNRISHEWLIGQGFVLDDEKPLCNKYQHSKNKLLFVTIGLYGELFIGEKHWCNDEFERIFATINPDLNQKSFSDILTMLNIKIP